MESNLDFLCISESWLNCNISSDQISVVGYSCYRKDRTSSKGGGVVIYIKEHFRCSNLDLSMNLECVGLNVTLSPNMNFNIVVLYNPPSHGKDFCNELNSLLSACDKCYECILLGDFNINWMVKSEKSKLKPLMEKFKYKQLVDKPTRITRKSGTLIDLIFTNRPERAVKTYNLITGLSDHNMILIVRKLTKKRLAHHSKIVNQKTTGIPQSKMADFENDLSQVNWETITKESTLKHSLNNFTSVLGNLVNKYTKTWKSRPKKPSLPWFNNGIHQLIKKRDLALKKSLVTKNNTDHLIFTSLRNKVVSELRKAKSNYFLKLIEEANGSSSKLWQQIHRLTDSSKQKHPKITRLKVDNNHIESNESMANVFNHFFIECVHELASHFKSTDLQIAPEECDNASSDGFCMKEVSSDTVKKIIANMNNSMSKDNNNLNASLIKKYHKYLLIPITYLVNLSIRTSTFPESWKTAAPASPTLSHTRASALASEM